MKIAPARSEAFVAGPDTRVVAVLLYGPDGGLVRVRAEGLVRTVAGDVSDPFRVAELTADQVRADPPRLADEAAAISLTGGRRAVRLRDAGDAVSAILANFLDDSPPGAGQAALVVVEAGELAPRSSLRRLFEGAANAAALACYQDEGEGLARLVRETLAARGVTASAEAVSYLAENLGGDRLVTLSELEKLALYAGEGGRIGVEEAARCVGDSARLTLEDVAFAAGGGDSAGLERGMTRAFLEGVAPVTVLRAVARHFQRLHLAAARRAAGAGPDQAMAALRPPVFFKRKGAFAAQLRLWPPRRAAAALELLTETETRCKETGQPAETLCRRALLLVSERAAQRRGRGGRPMADDTRERGEPTRC